MRERAGKPAIGIVADRRVGKHALHTVQEKYLDAVAAGAGGLALVLPARIEAPGSAWADEADINAVLDRLDGLFLTGAVSNVAPALYGQDLADPNSPGDAARDGASLALLRRAVARDMPVLAVCRGLQELNVALGGTLHQAIHDVPGFTDHRDDPEAAVEVAYGPAHEVVFAPDGMLARIAGAERVWVNSLHGQGIDRLAPGLAVEARAPDGVIEAVSMPGKAFVLGVQWHPEWRFREDATSRALFAAFGAASRDAARAQPRKAA